MKERCIRIRAVTTAQRAQEKLRDAGFTTRLFRAGEIGGCGFCIEVMGDYEEACRLLKKQGVRFSVMQEGEKR